MVESALKDLSVDSSVRILEKLREKWVSDQVTHLEYAKQKGQIWAGFCLFEWFFKGLDTVTNPDI